MICCCGHDHGEGSCTEEDCPCIQWHFYEEKHWFPKHSDKRDTMMHTFNTKSGVCIHYNSDRSGLAGITKPNGEMIMVPCEELVDFVAMLVRRDRVSVLEDTGNDDPQVIAELEKLSSLELLGLKP